MKTRVRNEQTRCSVAGGEESFVLDFLFLEPVLSFCRRVARQKKNTQFLNHLICGSYFENFSKLLIIYSKNISTNLLKWNKQMEGIIIFIILVMKNISN